MNLDVPRPSAQPRSVRGVGLWVAGRWWRHSAALFWARVLECAAVAAPSGFRLVLRAPGEGRLSRLELDPVGALERDAVRLAGHDVRAALACTFAQLALVGPPPPVSLCLEAADGRRLPVGGLGTDGLDAELLPYLVAWLLEWAGVPEQAWNDERVAFAVVAVHGGSGRRLALAAEFTTRPVQEGLLDRELVLHWDGEAPAGSGSGFPATPL